MGLFDKRVEYKPFEYPEYFTEGWLKQSQNFWLFTEISMQSDIKDWLENLNEIEKYMVEYVLLSFAQTETGIEDYWANVPNWFPKHEIAEMARAFSYFETNHAEAYSYLNEILELEDFKSFLRDPILSKRFELLVNTKADYTHKELKNSHEARCDVARSLAIFSGFGEGVALYSSFVILYAFSLRGLLSGIRQQMKYSIVDEELHTTMGCKLFRHLCEEYPEIKEEVKEEVLKAAGLIITLEHKFIDEMFKHGELENLKAEDLKHFITERTNLKLNELGYEGLYFAYDEDKARQLDWFYAQSSAIARTDFFTKRPTAYAKAGLDEDWDDII